ncbi:MAG TPA: DUF2520 domain-containing protein [Paludibaculum sp.]|jgi:predicted short-subunit dehydrogenase-like oxidoreductase (DUF2520 family)
MPPSANGHAAGIAIAGAGPVAQSLGRALEECGIPIRCIASRDLNHARQAAAFIGKGVAAVSYDQLPLMASHVIVAVTDRGIAPVAEELAAAKGSLRIALHTCGSYGPELLAPLRAAGVSCGTLHPLQSIRDPTRGAAAFRGVSFATSGDVEALIWAQEIATTLGGQVLHIRSEAHHLYHAAAVMASNYVAALLDSAEQLLIMAGVPKADALRALAPLTRASVENVIGLGAVDALTGPVVRGDAATVAEHVRAIEDADPSIASLYRAAGVHALGMAHKRGLGHEEAEAVRQALEGRR